MLKNEGDWFLTFDPLNPGDSRKWNFINLALVRHVTDYTGESITLWFAEDHKITVEGIARDLLKRLGRVATLSDGTRFAGINHQIDEFLSPHTTAPEKIDDPEFYPPFDKPGKDDWMR
jgi:hypothetical protein